MTLYREVLSRAWRLAWRHKPLWLLGFLATFWGSGNVYGAVIQSIRLVTQQNLFVVNLWHDVASAGITMNSWRSIATETPLYGLALIAGLVVLIGVLLFCYWVFTCSHVTVIQQVAAIEQQRSRRLVDAYARSRPFFWPVFILNVASRVLMMVVLLGFGWVVFSPQLDASPSLVTSLWYIAVFLLVVLVLLAILFVTVYATLFVVLRQYRLGQAIAAGWQLLGRYWLVSLETAGVLLVVSIAAAIAVLLLGVILLGPLYLAIGVAVLFSSQLVYLIGVLIMVAAIMVAVVLMTAWLTTFSLAVWVELFTAMTAGQVSSKLVRLAVAKKLVSA